MTADIIICRPQFPPEFAGGKKKNKPLFISEQIEAPAEMWNCPEKPRTRAARPRLSGRSSTNEQPADVCLFFQHLFLFGLHLCICASRGVCN